MSDEKPTTVTLDHMEYAALLYVLRKLPLPDIHKKLSTIYPLDSVNVEFVVRVQQKAGAS